LFARRMSESKRIKREIIIISYTPSRNNNKNNIISTSEWKRNRYSYTQDGLVVRHRPSLRQNIKAVRTNIRRFQCQPKTTPYTYACTWLESVCHVIIILCVWVSCDDDRYQFRRQISPFRSRVYYHIRIIYAQRW